MVNTDQFDTKLLDYTPNLILCKTRQCVAWTQQARRDYTTQIPIIYTGFTSIDPLLLTEPIIKNDSLNRFDKFLHMAGKSPHKGTLNILYAWIQHPQWPTLTVTSYDNAAVDAILANLQQQGMEQLPLNIRHVPHKLSQQELANIMASHGVHVCTSGMEGFGHSLNEARAVGALVITTDYPAMNELIFDNNEGVLIPPTELLTWRNGLPYANVDAHAIAQVMIEGVLPMTLQERAAMGARARKAYHEDQIKFAKRMERVKCYFQECNDETVSQKCAEEKCGLHLE
jgi:glycosyltransferase involved in cell wall biosynthesis